MWFFILLRGILGSGYWGQDIGVRILGYWILGYWGQPPFMGYWKFGLEQTLRKVGRPKNGG